MKLKTIYLVLCLLGTALPYWQFVPWLAENGLNMPLFFQQLFANHIGAFFGMDVFVSAAALLVFVRSEGSRLGVAGAVVAGDRRAHCGGLAWITAVSVPARTQTGAGPGRNENSRSVNSGPGNAIRPARRSKQFQHLYD